MEDEQSPGQQEQKQQEEIQSKWAKIEEPEETIKLFMVDFHHCDHKKCTGKKMERFKLLSTIKDKKHKFRGIVLSAFGKKEICAEDLPICLKNGICVIDCSWNRVEETTQFRYKHERKLPYCVAGNPVNYGKPYQLSCVEALTVGLTSVGYLQQAKFIISKFGWSQGFWGINEGIENYAKCLTLADIKAVSQENQEGKGIFQREYIMPESSEESDKEEA